MPLSSCPFYNCHILCVNFASEETVLPSPTTEIFIVLQGLAQLNTAFSLTFFRFLPSAFKWFLLLNLSSTLLVHLYLFPYTIKLFTCLLCLWVIAFLMMRVLSCLGHFFKLLISLSERKEGWQRTHSHWSWLCASYCGSFSHLHPLTALGGRELLRYVRDLRSRSVHDQDRRIQDPNLGHVYSKAVLSAFTHVACSYTLFFFHLITDMDENGKLPR